MKEVSKIFNKLVVAVYSTPLVKKWWGQWYKSIEYFSIPWTPLMKPVKQCKVALVTTGGVHLKTDIRFNMEDKNGDPTYRIIPSISTPEELIITHDYYNHADADRDINLVFPLEILRVCQQEGLVGKSSDSFYSFMGHITGPHIRTLIKKTSKQVAERMKQEGVDIAVLVPS